MTLVVLDASAAVKLVLAEPDRGAVLDLWGRPDLQFAAPAVALTEVAAALDAAASRGRLDRRARARAAAEWRRYRRAITFRAVDTRIALRAGLVAGSLRGADRLYLAVAAELGRAPVVSFDVRQRDVAQAMGIPVLPAAVRRRAT